MGKETSIAWTDSTFNFAWGCTKVSPGCKNCYMYRVSARFGRNPNVVTLMKQTLSSKIKNLGKRVFINPDSDTFHEAIPMKTIESWFEQMMQYPDHDFQVLTKRTNRAALFSRVWKITHGKWPENIWLGTSIESKAYLYRLETLKKIQGPKIKFISFEPLLENIGLVDLSGINWAIVGGESGKDARPMDPTWANWIRHQCEQQNIAFFFKQLGGKENHDGAGGDLLFGKQYKAFPKWFD